LQKAIFALYGCLSKQRGAPQTTRNQTMAIIYDLSKLAPDTQALILSSKKFTKWFSAKPDAMLRLDGSVKVIKGNKLGYKTAILYLAPANMSGVNVCAMAALAKCAEACLNTAGRGAMTGVQMSRLRKTLFFMQFQAEAIEMIKSEIKMFEARALKQGWTLLVRLNGTSDIRWENYGIIQAYPAVQFYDYTKLANRKNVPANYDLSFSYSGVQAYQGQVKIALASGIRIAAVFDKRETVKHMLANGIKFLGLDVVDGDDTDVRHIDPQGVVVALYAKGAAKSDKSGFVVRHLVDQVQHLALAA
jgi:hypothetical protein